MPTTASSPAAASQPSLSARDKLLNAIPLLIVLVITVYFVYSCQRSKEVTSRTMNFVERYQHIHNEFNQQLKQFLDGNITTADYKKHLQTAELKTLTDLQAELQALPDESKAAILCFAEAQTLLQKKLELVNTILNYPDPEIPAASLIPLLKDINELQQAIYKAANEK